MKFTQKEALENLKGILTNNGKKTLRMSEKTMNAQLETLMPIVANDEMELSDFVDKVKKSFESINSNIEKEKADFVKEYEKSNPKEEKEKDSDKDGDSKGNLELKALMEEMKSIKESLAKKEKAEKVSSIRDEFLKTLESKGVADKDWSKEFVSLISITEDFDVETTAEAALKVYNKSKAHSSGETPGGTGAASESGKEFDDIKKAREKKLEQEKQI